MHDSGSVSQLDRQNTEGTLTLGLTYLAWLVIWLVMQELICEEKVTQCFINRICVRP